MSIKVCRFCFNTSYTRKNDIIIIDLLQFVGWGSISTTANELQQINNYDISDSADCDEQVDIFIFVITLVIITYTIPLIFAIFKTQNIIYTNFHS